MPNKFLVGVRGDQLVILKPPLGVLTKEDALNLAAWIVALAEVLPGDANFKTILTTVQNT